MKKLLKENKITAKRAATFLLSANCEIERISEITKLPIEEIKEMKEIRKYKNLLIAKGYNINGINCIREVIENCKKEGKINMIQWALNNNEITAKVAATFLLSANFEMKTISEITKLPIEEIKNLND